MLARIRNKANVRELNIPSNKIEDAQEILSGRMSPYRKRELTKQILGGSLYICGGIPFYEIKSQVGDSHQKLTRIERFCEKCMRNVYERQKTEPKDSNELAVHYGVIPGQTHSIPVEGYQQTRIV